MTAHPAAGLTKIIDAFELNDLEEASATITYIGLQSVDGMWYLQKLDTSTGTVLSHATQKNNTTTTSYTTGWTNRATITYGDITDAF